MGRPIAVNLLNAGYQVSVYARRAATLSPLCALGARAYDSPRELAQHCNVIITNVSDTSDVEAVILGPQGVLEGAHPGSLVIDMSTISPSVTRTLALRLKERGVDMLDAPVSGGTQGAAEGTLSIMVGGDVALFEQALPLLQRIGKNIVYIGAHGAGQVAKACNQLKLAINLSWRKR
ncbi:MAG: 2-hydroxy-3-oxopropionate reductase [Halothiobacillaceae bacterium]|nr:MAG: 2-hydroxy-3-oxopropionate reductase [Halothiobacillaceae bacterium]